MYACQGGHVSCVKSLLRAQADPNLGGPLQLAVMSRNVKTTKALLQHRADPNAHKNGTPLVAISLMSLPMLRLFLSHGADPNARFNDVPLLHLAVHKGYAEAQALLAAGADVTEVSQLADGTVLKVAMEKDDAMLVKLLSEHPRIHEQKRCPCPLVMAVRLDKDPLLELILKSKMS